MTDTTDNDRQSIDDASATGEIQDSTESDRCTIDRPPPFTADGTMQFLTADWRPNTTIPVDFEPDNQLFVVPVEDVVAVFRREPSANHQDDEA